MKLCTRGDTLLRRAFSLGEIIGTALGGSFITGKASGLK